MSNKKYRKKPIIVDAIQWTGNNLVEIISFTEGRHQSAMAMKWDDYEVLVKEQGLKIFTLEGSYMATIGDYIIKGICGEFYPCKPDIFEKTYEPIEEIQAEQSAKEVCDGV